MAALTAASWTVTITKRTRGDKKRIHEGTMLLAGVDTYPTAGIPLPTIATFGFIRNMDNLVLWGQVGAAITGYSALVDKTAHKLQLFVSHDTAGVTTLPQDEEDAAGVPGARTWNFRAEGW